MIRSQVLVSPARRRLIIVGSLVSDSAPIYLNTLLVAWLPLRSVWQSFYVVNALLTAASALILYRGSVAALITGVFSPGELVVIMGKLL